MLDINRVTLLGRAGRDARLRDLQSGEKAASFSLATTARWKSKDGKRAEATEWHRIVVYGAAVKAAGEMVRKGAAVLVEGRIAQREYQDKGGETQKVTEIVVAGPQGMVNVMSARPKDGGGAAAASRDGGDEDARETGAGADADG